MFMKNTFGYSGLCVAICMTMSLSFCSCEDWTDVESLDIHTPSLEEQNPQLYADYLKDLNIYKASEHKLTIVSVENVADPSKQAERLSALPDSIDYISLNNPDKLSGNMLDEIRIVREKGTKVVYSIDFSKFEEEWKEMKKANPDLTEEEGRAYLDKRTGEMLALADNYDGIIADYTGRSLVSLKGEELEVYTSRQTNFLNKLKEWKQASDKSLFFYTNVQYLTAENMGIIGLADYIILKTALSTNGDDLSVKALLAVQAGEDAKELYEGINPVPADRFIACVQLPQPDDKNQVVGYWNTVDSEGNKTLATQGAAWWNVQASTGFERKGMFVMNVQDDYYNNTFSSIREVISIMNPSK